MRFGSSVAPRILTLHGNWMTESATLTEVRPDTDLISRPIDFTARHDRAHFASFTVAGLTEVRPDTDLSLWGVPKRMASDLVGLSVMPLSVRLLDVATFSESST